jgi:hypothetical protein
VVDDDIDENNDEDAYNERFLGNEPPPPSLHIAALKPSLERPVTFSRIVEYLESEREGLA